MAKPANPDLIPKILQAKRPCLFCGKRVAAEDKKKHAEEKCWIKK